MMNVARYAQVLRQYKALILSILYVFLVVQNNGYHLRMLALVDTAQDSRCYINGDPRLLAELGVWRDMTRAATPGKAAADAGDTMYGQGNATARAAQPQTSVAAVIVPSAMLLPDSTEPGPQYRANILRGYRQALLAGAPWFILGGTDVECAAAQAYLLHLRNPADALFPDAVLKRLARPANAVATRLKKSMQDVGTLAEWLPRGTVLRHLYWAEAGLSRRTVRGVGDYVQASAHGFTRYTLPALAELIVQQDMDAAHTPRAVEGADTAHDTELLHTAVYEDNKDDDDDEEEGTATARGFVPEQAPYAEAVHIDGSVDDGDDEEDVVVAVEEVNDDEARRRRSLRRHVDVTRVRRVDGLSLVVPAILTAPEADPPLQVLRTVEVLQLLIEQVVVRQGQLAPRAVAAATASRPATVHWWWLRRPHTVVVVTSSYERQRIRMYFMNAIRTVAKSTTHALQAAVQVDAARVAAEAARQHRAEHTAGSTTRDVSLPFDLHTSGLRQLLVVCPNNVSVAASVVYPNPRWLPLSEAALPAGVPQSCCWLARRLGVYSHYLYRNYRRWVDAITMNTKLAGGQFGDIYYTKGFIMDLAAGRIDLHDIATSIWND